MDIQAMGPETVQIRRAGTEDLPGIMRLVTRTEKTLAVRRKQKRALSLRGND